MTARASHVLLVLSAFLFGLVVFLAVLLYATGNLGTRTAGSGIGGPFALTDQNGKPVTDADFKGKPFLVFFGYTHCPDVCPTALFDISEDYLSSFDPHLRAATGDKAALEKMEKAYRVYAKKVPTGKDGDYSMDHSAIVYLMDKDGQFVAPFRLDRKPQDSAAELRKYL